MGIYAVLAARWSGPRGRVVAFEPTPSSADVARRHFAFDGLGPGRVQLVEAAVSDCATGATLHHYDAHAMPYVNSLAVAVDTDARPSTIDVAVVTIDEVCRELKVVPNIIRMDVQGAEVHALRGARETIRSAARLSLVVEMHPQCWPTFGVTEHDARDRGRFGADRATVGRRRSALRARHARRLEAWLLARHPVERRHDDEPTPLATASGSERSRSGLSRRYRPADGSARCVGGSSHSSRSGWRRGAAAFSRCFPAESRARVAGVPAYDVEPRRVPCFSWRGPNRRRRPRSRRQRRRLRDPVRAVGRGVGTSVAFEPDPIAYAGLQSTSRSTA